MRDSGLNENISLCCLDRHLPANWKYDESSIVIHHFPPPAHYSRWHLISLSLSPASLFFSLPPTLPLLLLFYVPLLPSICISSLLSSTSVSSSSSPLLLFTSTTCLLFLLSPHFHLLFPNVCPSLLSQLNHFSPHLIFPSPAPVICIPLSFSLSATFNLPFYHLHSCPLFPPPTGPVQCLRRGRWPPLSSQALLWRLVLLVPGQIQPGQETPHHGSYTVHQTHLLL